MLKSFLMSSLLLMSLNSFAQIQNTASEEASSITSVSVTEVDSLHLNLDEILDAPAPLPTNPVGEIITVIDSLIAIGKKIWPIIEAGRPVINTKLVPAISILPRLDNPDGVLNQMSNWSRPKLKSYRVSFKNKFNSEVVGFTYTLIFQHNGELNGKGKYVTSLKVMASDIYTSWGFSFDAASELVGISNVGTSADPVASGIMQVSYAVKGMLNEVRSSQSFYIDGTGVIEALGQ